MSLMHIDFFALDYNGHRLNLTIVQYIVASEEDSVEIKPHGYASSEPYFCTSFSTLQAI